MLFYEACGDGVWKCACECELWKEMWDDAKRKG